MYLNTDKLKSNNLLGRFLDNPNQDFTDEEFQRLRDMIYDEFLTDFWSSQINLLQFLCIVGHLSGLNCLSEKLHQEILQDMIKADNYLAFQSASELGHLEVLKYLARQVPELLQEMIKADCYFTFWLAVRR